MRTRKLVLVALIAFLAPHLLGAEGCPRPELDLAGHVIQRLLSLEDRVDEVESCTCCCDGIFEPVCASDGHTYVNRCEARCSGNEIVGRGRCVDSPCRVGEESCEPGFFCEQPIGCPDPEAPGTCEEQPVVCTREYQPVCGCDEVTYGNDCSRRAAGVSLLHPGECEPNPEGCQSNADCEVGERCARPPGSCGATGVCERRPDACILVYDPVCGCDGKTYSNACAAAAAGTSVSHAGECRPQVEACGGIAGLACEDPTAACIFPPGTCDIVDNLGVCTVPPRCAATGDPVCGCDGETYPNACQATAAGVSIDHAGRCEDGPEICGGIGGFACERGEICVYPPGRCAIKDDLGVCQSAPTVCTEEYLPVCSCDGTTYPNECFALAAGARIDHVGPCEVMGPLQSSEGELLLR